MTRPKTLSLLLLTLLTLTLASCLDAKKEIAVSYNPATDTFRLLRVYYHISASTPAELDYLGALYDNRRDIIPGDVVAIFGESAYFRLDAKKFYTISLGQAATQPKDPTDSPVDLATLGNKPGHFFLSGDQTLCYYHQIDIPGAFADGLLKEANGKITEGLAKAVADEITRRQTGGPLGSWDDVRASLDKAGPFTGPTPETQPTDTQPKAGKDNPFTCIDADSLDLLQKFAAAKRPVLGRTGSTITATVELSAADRQQVQATFDALKKKAADYQAKKDLNAEDRQKADMIVGLLDLAKLTSAADNHITLSADLIAAEALYEKIMGPGRFKEVPDPAKKDAYATTVEAAKAHGIPLDNTIKLADLIARFKKGDLPVDQEMKVKPGAGLFSPPTAPMTAP